MAGRLLMTTLRSEAPVARRPPDASRAIRHRPLPGIAMQCGFTSCPDPADESLEAAV
jgi:hypothetical protein